MKPPAPPRLASALLDHLVPDNDPLAGDLVEDFRSGRRSRLWFWRQALLAAVIAAVHRGRERRPLRLGLDGPGGGREQAAAPSGRPRAHVNLSASPTPWIGGLGLVALGVLVAVMTPWAVWLLPVLLAGGILTGIVMVVVSRRRVLAGSGGDRALVLLDRDGTSRPR